MKTENKTTKIKNPKITEKAALLAEKGIYVFNVDKDATKSEIIKDIKSTYKVNPVKVNIINTKQKKVFVRGKIGYISGSKSAMVFLKKGEKIDIAI